MSRQLAPHILQGQDLGLTLTRDHRSMVVELASGLLRRTFTLRPRRIPDVSAAERGREALSRALCKSCQPGEDDVADPRRWDDTVYRQMVRELTPWVKDLLAWEYQYR